jgi:hypothetical protein
MWLPVRAATFLTFIGLTAEPQALQMRNFAFVISFFASVRTFFVFICPFAPIFELSIEHSDFFKKLFQKTLKSLIMTTTTNNQTNDTPTEDKTTAVVCVCCLTFFPLMYLIGSTVMNFFG